MCQIQHEVRNRSQVLVQLEEEETTTKQLNNRIENMSFEAARDVLHKVKRTSKICWLQEGTREKIERTHLKLQQKEHIQKVSNKDYNKEIEGKRLTSEKECSKRHWLNEIAENAERAAENYTEEVELAEDL